MASQSRVTRDVSRAVSQRGMIRGKNPISTLCAIVDANNVAGKQQVETAISDLEKSGNVIVRRLSNGMIDSITHRSPRKYIDRTELSPQEKRERTFAKGVPSTLPDSLCSRVVVTKIDPKNSEKEADPMSWRYTPGAPYHETLTKCLELLRREADESGTGYEKSIATILMVRGGMTKSQAQRAMEFLRRLRLYETTMTGFRSSSYTVDMELKTITPEMVSECSRQRQVRKMPAAKQAAEDLIDTPSVLPEGSVQVVGETLGHDDPMHVLAAIIDRQDITIANLNQSINDLGAALTALTSENDALQQRNGELLAQVGNLEDQLAARHNAISDRVAKIIERHKL